MFFKMIESGGFFPDELDDRYTKIIALSKTLGVIKDVDGKLIVNPEVESIVRQVLDDIGRL